MSILIKKAGILDTLQDLGRHGFRKFGINPNGAMDRSAVRILNTLLANKEDEAVLEIHFPAPKIRFNKNCTFAVGGGDFRQKKNRKPYDNWTTQNAAKGDILEFGQKLSGNRSYLAVKGGFKVKTWLHSASTNLKSSIGGYDGRPIKKGDILEFSDRNQPKQSKRFSVARSILPDYSKSPTVRITASAEYHNLTAKSELNFLRDSYKVSSNSDRMGFHLLGNPLHLLSEKEIVSSAVNFGTIQLLPTGQLIVLMADHQTTGGYPRIANIIGQDLPLIAQLNARDHVDFELISIKEAERIRFKFEKDLSFLRFGLHSGD